MIVQGSTQAGTPVNSAGPPNRNAFDKVTRNAGKPQAVQSLEAAMEKAKETRKALAAERVKQLREQMRVMRWFAIANPKTAAQQAARLGQDLKSAVRDYTDPGQGLPFHLGHAAPEFGTDEDGAAIRQKLRSQLDALKKTVDDEPKDRAFVVDVLALRASIAGLVDVAKNGTRNDPASRRAIRNAQHSLQAVSGLLGQTPQQIRSNVGILDILA